MFGSIFLTHARARITVARNLVLSEGTVSWVGFFSKSGIALILALILIAQHWLGPILGIPTIVFFYLSMPQEEQSNIQKFGDNYVAYMKTVLRMNLILGIIRVLRRQKHS